MIEIARYGGVMTMTISGRFDFRCIADFQAALKADDRAWVVDLSRVEYIDSSGLGMLLLLRERAGGDVSRVKLRGLHGQPGEVLQMARFDAMFAIEAA